MKIRGRLIVAFIIMITMPIVLITAATSAIVTLQLNSIYESYDIETNTVEVISNPIRILNRLTRGVYNEIKLAALKTPQKLEDENYIKELNDEILVKYSFIAVRKNDKYVFVGDEKKLGRISNSLPKFGVYNTDVDGGIYLGGRNPFLVKTQHFYFSDGSEGTVFVITDLNNLVPQIKAVAVQGMISFLFVLIFTAMILSIWIYRSIIKRLNILRLATNQMKEGNLDYSVSSDLDDEIGQLFDDFEEMRVRLKKLIEDRLKYEEEIKELVSNISHDLKTPLTAIKGYAEGLLDGVADTKNKQDKYLKTILKKSNDMSVLIDELSFYAKIDSNTLSYDFKEINLHEYFTDCIDERYLDLELKNTSIEYVNHLDHNIRVIADGEQLKRVISNIIENSVKYLDKISGNIKIVIEKQGDFAQIAIEDNGSGIAQEDLPHIFERFYRADTSRNSTKGGSGLGLAISRKIIEDHGGKIWAQSQQGFGTTIFFTLKIVKSNIVDEVSSCP